jgi:hypothetical protein
MTKSLKSGKRPLISKELANVLDNDNDEIYITGDEFDRIIIDNNLKIGHFTFFRDLDLAVFVLNNKHIIQRPLSTYPQLNDSIDYHLLQYRISPYGIHWPELDIDLSLRGLLLEETVRFATV